MNTSKNIGCIGTVLKLLLFILIIISLFWLFDLFNKVEPPVQAAMVTALVGFGSLVITNLYTTQREINLKLREKKVEVYSELLKSWITAFLDLTLNARENNYQPNSVSRDQTLNKFIEQIKDIKDDLILWGSDEIIKKYSQLTKDYQEENKNDLEQTVSLIMFGKFMLSLRKDIGHNNIGIDEYDLMSIFINDIDDYRELKPEIDKIIESKK
ncbi:MAG TPA: hypothetical protein VK184_11735 [Nostocaceae cyanobacterium]|nr:hypothetical protein [Nostocaceae cyanobacterium]